MRVKVVIEGADALAAYASVPIAYRAEEILDLNSPEPGSLLQFTTRRVDEPIEKNYDALPGNNPLDWPKRFHIRDWAFIAAFKDDERMGGAIVVAGSPDIEMLEARDDLALLWDIRVSPASRGKGVGTALLTAAESWARSRQARVLKVETQNTNVPACRFYARHGFKLRTVNRDAYPDLPGEAQLLWYKELVA